jgi:hypothetical protein
MRGSAPLLLCFLLTLGGCASELQRHEARLNLDPGWLVALASEVPGFRITEIVRSGDDLRDWHELIVSEIWRKPTATPTARADFEAIKAKQEKDCPGSARFVVLAEAASSLTYEVYLRPCSGWRYQYEILRIIDAPSYRWHVAYTAKVENLSPDRHSHWVDWMAGLSVRE